ncbi:hypothetical protein FE257_003190 [Aspergillus nanangensis]|uniref:ATPase inhibitor, mitochondrial n=1 Tax=Aspergillus nanangensis TaxID=2582783 RepID=A0AAD4CBT6_ASPNN|nr:hypothetical protein FE257_003190 [Aspergillus nanangensis]
MSFLLEVSRPVARAGVKARSFSIAVPARKEGDMYSPKPRGFLAERDAPVVSSFRRPSNPTPEDLLAKAQQAEQLRTLRYKMQEQRQHLADLDRYIQDFARSQGL